jgi:hypothetical protein
MYTMINYNLAKVQHDELVRNARFAHLIASVRPPLRQRFVHQLQLLLSVLLVVGRALAMRA